MLIPIAELYFLRLLNLQKNSDNGLPHCFYDPRLLNSLTGLVASIYVSRSTPLLGILGLAWFRAQLKRLR